MDTDPYFVTQDNGAGAPIHFATTYKQLDMVIYHRWSAASATKCEPKLTYAYCRFDADLILRHAPWLCRLPLPVAPLDTTRCRGEPKGSKGVHSAAPRGLFGSVRGIHGDIRVLAGAFYTCIGMSVPAWLNLSLGVYLCMLIRPSNVHAERRGGSKDSH